MLVCPGSSLTDLESTCARAFWTSVAPAVLVVALVLFQLPLPTHVARALRYLSTPFRRFLRLQEAVELQHADVAKTPEPAAEEMTRTRYLGPSHGRTNILVILALVQCVAWVGFGTMSAVLASHHGQLLRLTTAAPFLISSTWLFSAIRLILNSKATPSYDLLALWLLHFIGAVFSVAAVLYDYVAWDTPMPSKVAMLGLIGNLVVTVCLLWGMLLLPIALPSEFVDATKIGSQISPEDYCTLWQWISFSWMTPFIARGTNATLNESDVWELSPTMQSQPLFTAFQKIKPGASLLRRLWACSSCDMIIDFSLTVTSVALNYAGPFFLNNILKAIGTDSSPDARAKAYVFAFLSFFAACLKAESDIIHLWHGRRASTRVRSILVASIYEKGLKRKDFAGAIVDKDKEEPSKDAKKSQGKKGQASTSGADIGKIVQLMSGDANRIGNHISGLYFIYGAPFEIIFAATFLYQLMGWTAFTGFGILIVISPLNSMMTRRGIRINRELLAARDKRMSVLNELIAEAKFIKLFAWESQWLGRAFKARQFELGKLVKSALNGLMFSLVWSSAPALVCIISFLSFILSGRELTIPIAFTALALFRMLSTPLNVIPSSIVSILQTAVALERIDTFLREDEVTDVASSLKKPAGYRQEDQTLGVENGNFKWNVLTADATKAEPTKPAKKWLRLPWKKQNTVESDQISETSTLSQEPAFELRDISVTFPSGRLTLVTGPTASGKTALLLALLGEMQADEGTKIFLPKDTEHVAEDGFFNAVSFAAQRPWLQHLSIRDNITFGAPFEQDRYDAVVDACALRPDLARFEDGDLTEIGVRGVSLSGGQKARVALARAIYQKTRHVLLDDPLSAVDSHTARWLFERLLCGPLMKNRTVVLVTHHVDLVVPGADYLVRMLDGRIDISGSIKDLKREGQLQDIVLHAKAEEAEGLAPEADPALKEAEAASVITPAVADAEAAQKRPRKLVKDEARAEGSVKWTVYKAYISASSYFVWAVVLFLILVGQFLFIAERLWMKTWGEAYGHTPDAMASHAAWVAGSHSEHLNGNAVQILLQREARVTVNRLPSAETHPMFYISVFACITLGNAVLSVVLGAVQLLGAYLAGKRMFKQLTIAVVRAPFRFHDQTPAGRLLNRFSKDIETVDSSLAGSMRAVTNQLAGFAAAVLTIAWVLPGFLIPATFISYVYWKLAVGYLNTGRDLRRMESNARSPIFSGFSELLEGITTVRAFSVERRFFVKLHKHLDLTTQMWYSFWMTNRWLLLRFDLLGATAVLITTLFGLFAMNTVGYAGWAGVTITSAMSLTSSIYWCCRFVTQLELDLNSVERVVEYLDVPSEPPAIIENNRPPAYWPSSNTTADLVTVENLSLRYAPELPDVLHNLSFTLKPRERVGLLGRTGSGKSTLAMSLLRFTDPTEGKIIIDGIDITSIGVQDLRSRITIIPQDSALFSGTLRENLDPFNDYSDSECLAALRRVQMITDSSTVSRPVSRAASVGESSASVSGFESTTDVPDVSADPTVPVLTLESPVSAGGANYSQGQRQLLAMARALLRQSSVIIFDEATSSIDFKSDARIQATIREEFSNSLLITVAHRLRTIIDFDRLLVLEGGELVEIGTPYDLIRKEGGYFRKLCQESGTFSQLEESAAAAAAAREMTSSS